MTADPGCQHLGGEDGEFQNKLSVKTCVSELWVQLRDPASVHKVESNQGRLLVSASGCLCVYPHTLNTHTHVYIHYIHIHMQEVREENICHILHI